MVENQTVNLDRFTQILNNKKYYSILAESELSCKGCTFNKEDRQGSTFCKCNDAQMVDICYEHNIIWKDESKPVSIVNTHKTSVYNTDADNTSEEPKFTVEQVLLAAKVYLHNVGIIYNIYEDIYPEVVKDIEQYLMKQNDPEYQLYLKLKTKYENKTW